MEHEYRLVDTFTNEIGTVNIYRPVLTEEERKRRMDHIHKRLAEILVEDARRNQKEAVGVWYR